MDRAEYEKTYPKYCRKCKGWGMFHNRDLRFWDCECISNSLCPRCGKEHAFNEMDTCTACGWHRDDRERGLPGSIGFES